MWANTVPSEAMRWHVCPGPSHVAPALAATGVEPSALNRTTAQPASRRPFATEVLLTLTVSIFLFTFVILIGRNWPLLTSLKRRLIRSVATRPQLCAAVDLPNRALIAER